MFYKVTTKNKWDQKYFVTLLFPHIFKLIPIIVISFINTPMVYRF